MRKIYIYENDGKCQIENFVLKTNQKIQKKLKFQLAYIMDKHNAFTEPHVKHFTIEKYRRLGYLQLTVDMYPHITKLTEKDFGDIIPNGGHYYANH